MSEIDKFIEMNTSSDITKKRYRDWYKRLITELNTETLLDVDKNLILDAVIKIGKKSKIDWLIFTTNLFSKLNPGDDLTLFSDNLKSWRSSKMNNQKDKNKAEISIMKYTQLNAILNNAMKTIEADDYNAICINLIFYYEIQYKK
jgi:Leucine-rich repeat (LRR) protein